MAPLPALGRQAEKVAPHPPPPPLPAPRRWPLFLSTGGRLKVSIGLIVSIVQTDIRSRTPGGVVVAEGETSGERAQLMVEGDGGNVLGLYCGN